VATIAERRMSSATTTIAQPAPIAIPARVTAARRSGATTTASAKPSRDSAGSRRPKKRIRSASAASSWRSCGRAA
jgi:hypothetical protein